MNRTTKLKAEIAKANIPAAVKAELNKGTKNWKRCLAQLEHAEYFHALPDKDGDN